ncbi:MAG: hypothetical protein JWR00_4137 [Rubritepida sp.]|nr:hypothetical protein [Rubritepida sp.]
MSDSPAPEPAPAEEPVTENVAPCDIAEAADQPRELAAQEIAPATERPVPSRRPLQSLNEAASGATVPPTNAAATSAYVLTVDNATGNVTAFEHLDQETGERRPLSNEDYALALTYAAVGTPGSLAAAGPGLSVLAAQAYYAGVLDYLNALTRMAKAPS